jgi:hypothetical protein
VNWLIDFGSFANVVARSWYVFGRLLQYVTALELQDVMVLISVVLIQHSLVPNHLLRASAECAWLQYHIIDPRQPEIHAMYMRHGAQAHMQKTQIHVANTVTPQTTACDELFVHHTTG